MTNIPKLIQTIEDKIKDKSDKEKKELWHKLDVEFNEKTKFYQINIESFANGLIDIDISQWVYNKLNDYENTSLVERIIITQLMSELLQKRINERLNKK